jgi:hypothetical protein
MEGHHLASGRSRERRISARLEGVEGPWEGLPHAYAHARTGVRMIITPYSLSTLSNHAEICRFLLSPSKSSGRTDPSNLRNIP